MVGRICGRRERTEKVTADDSEKNRNYKRTNAQRKEAEKSIRRRQTK